MTVKEFQEYCIGDSMGGSIIVEPTKGTIVMSIRQDGWTCSTEVSDQDLNMVLVSGQDPLKLRLEHLSKMMEARLHSDDSRV